VYQPPLENMAADSDLSGSALLSAIVNSSEDAIVGQSSDGLITSWNPAAGRVYGYSAEEIIGQPATVVCPPGRADEVTQILAAIGRGERGTHFETERLRKDGSTFPVSVTVSPIRDEHGRLVGASSIARDIGEQRQLRATAEQRGRAAAADRASQDLATFTHAVSHDLRAPLRAMGGYSEILLEEFGDVLGEVGRGYAGRIQAAGDQMAALLADLLRLSRERQAQLHLQPVDLGAEAAGIAADLQRAGPDRVVRFVIQRPVEARADRALIRSALESLLGNAWKFTSRRDDASIEFGTRPAGDTAVTYFVRDNGAGFDPAYADKLFQPFQRLHPAGEFPGTGVGLASVRQIVERHGGRVWAEGAVGAGATFSFTLDAKDMS
jgi:PAS domain S-box-containing protein